MRGWKEGRERVLEAKTPPNMATPRGTVNMATVPGNAAPPGVEHICGRQRQLRSSSSLGTWPGEVAPTGRGVYRVPALLRATPLGALSTWSPPGGPIHLAPVGPYPPGPRPGPCPAAHRTLGSHCSACHALVYLLRLLKKAATLPVPEEGLPPCTSATATDTSRTYTHTT